MLIIFIKDSVNILLTLNKYSFLAFLRGTFVNGLEGFLVFLWGKGLPLSLVLLGCIGWLFWN